MARPVTPYAPRRPVGPGRLQRRPSSNEVLETGGFHTPAWPHSLAGATGHARQIFYSFLLPLAFFGFLRPSISPPFLQYVPYSIPDRCCCCCMHACMHGDSFPQTRPRCFWYDIMHWQVPSKWSPWSHSRTQGPELSIAHMCTRRGAHFVRLTYRPDEHPVGSGAGSAKRVGVRSSVPAPHTESGFEMPLGWVSGCVAWFVGFFWRFCGFM